MVDNRVPLPYEIPGTELRSPDGWGLPRHRLADGWTPPRRLQTSNFQITAIVNHVYALHHREPATAILHSRLHGRRAVGDGAAVHVQAAARPVHKASATESMVAA